MQQFEDADAPDGVELYDFSDFKKHRELIFKDAQEGLMNQFPKSYNGKRLELVNVNYSGKDHFSIAEQKKALHNDEYLSRNLRGSFRLIDEETGKVLDESKEMTLMRVPYLTDRGTFVYGGNDYGSISQQRMLPGPYTRYQSNGDLETHFNIRPGTGTSFRVNFNPESAQYKIAIGGSELQLYSLLKDLGTSDEDMRKRWGDEIFDTNAGKYDARVFEKAYTKIVPEWDRKANPNRTHAEKVELIKNALNRSQVATSVARKTLPNLFDMAKSASWREYGEAFEKCASLNREDVEDIATYIGTITGMNVDTSQSKEALVTLIRSVVKTGIPNGDLRTGNINPNDKAAEAVRNANAQRIFERLSKKLRK